MALSTNAALLDDDGTGYADAIVASGGSQDLADGAFSSAAGATHSVIDNSTTKAPAVKIQLQALDGWGATPAAGGAVHVYLREREVDGTNHAPTPDGNHRADYVGSIVIDAATAASYQSILVPTLGHLKFEVHIENDCGATLTDSSSGWKVRAKLASLVPKAA